MKKFCFTLFVLMGLVSPAGYSQQVMPSDAALNKAMEAARAKTAGVLNDAVVQSKPSTVVPKRIVPDFSGGPAGGVDPARIAEKYQSLDRSAEGDSPELMVFASLSMPEEALKRLGEQAKRAGAVVVFRGLKYGLNKGGWNKSLEALKPIADTGADVQIHPELFTRYNIQVVPTLVVAAAPQKGCQENACDTQSVAVVGDVSIDYALETLVGRKDKIGKIAREKIKLMRNG